MIQIRDVFQVKFGSIDQAVELFINPAMPAPAMTVPGRHFEVLTDITGKMYALVSEYAAQDLGEYETIRSQQFAAPEFDKWFKQFQLFVEGGQREFYNIEGSYESWSGPGLVVVRESYRAYKWQIRTVVALLERYGGLLVDRGVGQRPRILTDASGSMFKAIIEIETESMSTWEKQRRSLFRQVEFRVWFNQMLTAVDSGSHEFYRVEYTHD